MNNLDDLPDICGLNLPTKQFTTTAKIDPCAMRVKLRRSTSLKMKEKKARELVETLPEPGEAIHLVSSGIFDYWTLVPVIVEMLGGHVKESRFSTWAMTMPVCKQFIEMIQGQKLGECGFIADRSLQRMQGPVYAQIVGEFLKNDFPFRVTKCHAKIALLHMDDDWIVIEGSANFTNNPRIEQMVILNDRSVYEFHKAWMAEIFNALTHE